MVKRKPKTIPNSNGVEKPATDTGLLPLITEEEWSTREQHYQQRIQDVKVCLGFISESIEGYQTLLKLQSKHEHWDRYVSCDNLPRVQEPPELRRFLAKIQHVEELNEHAVVNWALSVDERSILTQDIEAKDLTRKVLKQNLRPDIGKQFDEAVQRILITLDRIELFLDCEFEMAEIPPERVIEISLIRDELNQAIDVLFDKLTYRIICAPSSYKTQFEGITESYCYTSPKFNFQIWWLTDVPVRFKYLDLPLMIAKLDCVGVDVQIPISVLCDNLTLRCVHTYFDPYSEKAKSYIRVIDKSPNELNAGFTDIEDCLINEWLMQVSILNQMITRMEQKMIMYEENMREMENGRKSLKLPKEPQKLPEGMFPDPYKYFLQQEQQEFDEFLEQYLSPQHLKLQPDEINLRRYAILGGIFSMSFVHKPKHTDFAKFNRTFHEDKRELCTMDHIRAFVAEETAENNDNDSDKRNIASFASSARSRKSSHFTRSLLQLTASADLANNKNLHFSDEDLKYFFVRIKLPKELCRFGEPVACQYLDEIVDEEEPEDKITEEEGEEQRLKKKRKKNTPRQAKKSDISGIQRSTTPRAKKKITSKIVEEDEFRYEFNRPQQSSIMPKLSVPNNIYRPSFHTSIRSYTLRHSIIPQYVLHNFELNKEPLNSIQLNDLKKHCIPRILSSFKFPQEFKIEKVDEFIERTKGNKILRRNQPVVTEVYTDEPEYFSYEKQEAPERLYPIFDSREKVVYEQDSSEEDTSSISDGQVKVAKVEQITEPVKKDAFKEQSMYTVLQTLDDIQTKYKERALRMDEQSNFLVRGRSRMSSPTVSSSKSKTTVRISTIGSRLIHIHPRYSRGNTRSSNFDSLSFDSSESQHSIGSVHSVGFRHARKSSSPREHVEKEPQKKIPKKINVKHWTTKYISNTEFNRENLTMTIKTDRLGLFGFAYKRYEHFPFRAWKLQQNEEQPNEIIFTLDTFHVRIILYITNVGIRGYVTKIVNEFVANPVKYLEIKEPISDYRELRRRFLEKNINIFAEHDARYYIENGYFSEKHLSTELHIYDAFAIHCKLIKFYRCDWNRLAPRRDIILCLRNPKDVNDGADVTVRVTPDCSTFVEVSEPCSLDLDDIKLDYQLTWRNIGTYSDLHQLINSMYPQATDVRNRDPKLIHYIRTLFTEVRPLSFS